MAKGDITFQHFNLSDLLSHQSIAPPTFSVDQYRTAAQCVRCKEFKLIGPCPNCDGRFYRPGYFEHGPVGLSCTQCNIGENRWICPKCKTDNAMANTFGQFRAGFCFIATAAFERVDAPEVVFLREFRDVVLLPCRTGTLFVDLYYQWSPWIARLVSRSPFLRHSFRVFLSLLVAYLGRKCRHVIGPNDAEQIVGREPL